MNSRGSFGCHPVEVGRSRGTLVYSPLTVVGDGRVRNRARDNPLPSRCAMIRHGAPSFALVRGTTHGTKKFGVRSSPSAAVSRLPQLLYEGLRRSSIRSDSETWLHA